MPRLGVGFVLGWLATGCRQDLADGTTRPSTLEECPNHASWPRTRFAASGPRSVEPLGGPAHRAWCLQPIRACVLHIPLRRRTSARRPGQRCRCRARLPRRCHAPPHPSPDPGVLARCSGSSCGIPVSVIGSLAANNGTPARSKARSMDRPSKVRRAARDTLSQITTSNRRPGCPASSSNSGMPPSREIGMS